MNTGWLSSLQQFKNKSQEILILSFPSNTREDVRKKKPETGSEPSEFSWRPPAKFVLLKLLIKYISRNAVNGRVGFYSTTLIFVVKNRLAPGKFSWTTQSIWKAHKGLVGGGDGCRGSYTDTAHGTPYWCLQTSPNSLDVYFSPYLSFIFFAHTTTMNKQTNIHTHIHSTLTFLQPVETTVNTPSFSLNGALDI